VWVTVWRHGEAGPAATDRERVLTARGEASVVSAADPFARSLEAKAIPAVTRILSSPWCRTQQTAQLLARAFSLDVELHQSLAPDRAIAGLEALMSGVAGHVVLVSHQPLVSELLWYWLDSGQLAPLSPGGWATVELFVHGRGAGKLLNHRVDIF
jgi:phosphohistidine phosphatase